MSVSHNKLIDLALLEQLKREFVSSYPTYSGVDNLFNQLRTDSSLCGLVHLPVTLNLTEGTINLHESPLHLNFDQLMTGNYYCATNFQISVQLVDNSPKLIGYCFSPIGVEILDKNMNVFYQYLDANNQFTTITELNNSSNSRVDPTTNNSRAKDSCGWLSLLCNLVVGIFGSIVGLAYLVTTYLLSWTGFIIIWAILIGIELYALSAAAIAITESSLIAIALGTLGPLILIFLVLVLIYALSVIIIDAAKDAGCEGAWSVFCDVVETIAPYGFRTDEDGNYIDTAHEAAQGESDQLDEEIVDLVEDVIDKGVDKSLDVAGKVLDTVSKYAFPLIVGALIIYSK